MRRGIVGRNVATLVDAPSADEPEMEPLDEDEARAILEVAASQRNGTRWSVGLGLGLRQCEALGTRWSDIKWPTCRQHRKTEACPPGCQSATPATFKVHWQLKRLRYRHGCEDAYKCGKHREACPQPCAKHRHREGCASGCRKKRHVCPNIRPCPPDCTRHASTCAQRLGGWTCLRPKGKARREVVIPPPLVPRLREHRAVQLAERLAAGEAWDDWDDWDLVWCQRNGRPIDPHDDWEEWKALLVVAKVGKDARVHDARHTAATLLLEQGVDIRVVQEILGHSQPSTTKRYAHVTDKLARDAARRMGNVLWG